MVVAAPGVVGPVVVAAPVVVGPVVVAAPVVAAAVVTTVVVADPPTASEMCNLQFKTMIIFLCFTF